GQFVPESPGQFAPELVVSLPRNQVVWFIRISTLIIIDILKSNLNFSLVKCVYLAITNVIAISLVVEFLLVLLMILKRFFLIFKNEID
nr:hypothetical protein [Mucilaginibacter sp. SP1R1]